MTTRGLRRNREVWGELTGLHFCGSWGTVLQGLHSITTPSSCLKTHEIANFLNIPWTSSTKVRWAGLTRAQSQTVQAAYPRSQHESKRRSSRPGQNCAAKLMSHMPPALIAVPYERLNSASSTTASFLEPGEQAAMSSQRKRSPKTQSGAPQALPAQPHQGNRRSPLPPGRLRGNPPGMGWDWEGTGWDGIG